MDAADSRVRILFMDFSSAFNSVNINTLLWRLEELHVLKLWFYGSTVSYWTVHNMCWLMAESQNVVLNSCFYLYKWGGVICIVIKYAEDMILVGCVKDSQSLDNYFNFEIFYTTWMEESSLQLNTKCAVGLIMQEIILLSLCQLTESKLSKYSRIF